MKRSRTLRWFGEVLYYLVLVTIFVQAISLRAQLPLVPFVDPDSWDYLQPALIELFHGTSAPTYREFLYPWLLRSILQVHPNFGAISLVQHSAGILTAVVLLTAWHRMRIFLPERQGVDFLHRLGGLVLVTVYLFSQISILMEHTIRPEAFYPLIIALCLWIATEFSRRVFLKRQFGWGEATFSVLLVFLSFVAYYLRPYWGVGALFAISPVLASILVPGARVAKAGTLLCGLALIWGLLALPNQWNHSATKHTGNESYLAEILFVSYDEIIYDVLKEDAQRLPSNDPKRPAVEGMLHSMDRVAAAHGRLPFGYARMNPDDVWYRGGMERLWKNFHEDFGRLKNFCYYYFFQAWRKYPIRMFQKVGVQLWYFYSPNQHAQFDRRRMLDVPAKLQRSEELLMSRPSFQDWPPFRTYTQQVSILQSKTVSVQVPALVLFLNKHLNKVYLLGLLLIGVAGILVWSGCFGEMGKPFQGGCLWGLYLFSYNFGTSLTIAFVHVMSQTRYHYGQTLFSVISECFALVFLLSLAMEMIASLNRRRRISSGSHKVLES